VPPVTLDVIENVLPEQIALTLVTVTAGLGLTVSVMVLEALVQVELDKLATSGPTTTRYKPPSPTTADAIE